MSGGKSIGFVDLAAFSYDLDRACCVLMRSFPVRMWCRVQERVSFSFSRPRFDVQFGKVGFQVTGRISVAAEIGQNRCLAPIAHRIYRDAPFQRSIDEETSRESSAAIDTFRADASSASG